MQRRRLDDGLADSATVALFGVGVRYGDVDVLVDVDVAVGAGDLVAVSGVNGAGKTTLLRVLAGVFRPTTGHRIGPPTCAYVPAVVEHTPITTRSWLAGMPRQRRTESKLLLDALGFDGDLTSDCRTLSFGNARKMLLAEALSSGEQLIVIDEASAGLDQRGLAGLVDIVSDARSSGTSFVFADQQSRPVPNATVSYLVAAGSLRAAAAPERATIQLTGPAANVDSLITHAHQLGFTVESDRS